MSKQSLRDYSLEKLLALQTDLDAFLQTYALLPQLDKVRTSIYNIYPLLLEVIEEKTAEAREAAAIQAEAQLEAEIEARADEGRLF